MMIRPNDHSHSSGQTVGGPALLDGAGAIDSAFRLLSIRGLSKVEAGNVVAYTAGLRAADRGWTAKEIKQLLALRSFVARGLIES
jgi:hypothetical protein